jgi:hypothetical protein
MFMAACAAGMLYLAGMSITFPVSDVRLPEGQMPALDREITIPTLLGGGVRKPPHPRNLREKSPPVRRVEAFSSSSSRLVWAGAGNAFAQAAHDAFYLHYPLVLSPDAVWFCLAQGFARHVAMHAEELRGRLVRHTGKQKLVIERTDFVLGQPNPWPEVFCAFSQQIAASVGRVHELVVADFSTTGPVERAASEVLVMDIFHPYFEYGMRWGCGIPSISLLGTVDDWKSVRRRAAMFSEFGLDGWTSALLPVLDEVVRTAEGHLDRTFWRSFFRYDSSSWGGCQLTGWILTFFPYLAVASKMALSPYLKGWEEAWRQAEQHRGRRIDPEGPWLEALPGSLASAPVRFVDLRDHSETPMRFVAGLWGVTQDPSGALTPEFGWAVIDDYDAD